LEELTAAFMQLDDTICYCFHVRKRKIINFVRLHKPRRASQISECGGAGTGCGWCIPYLKRYFEQIEQGGEPANEAMTPEEYASLRGEYIKAGKGVPAAGAIPPPEAEK